MTQTTDATALFLEACAANGGDEDAAALWVEHLIDARARTARAELARARSALAFGRSRV